MQVSIPGKAAKRSYIAGKIPNLDQNKYPLENNETELGEYYLNVEICKKVAEYIRKYDSNIKVVEFYSKDKSTDLNAAGRKALTYEPDLYLSIHHNCTDKKEDNVRGYVCMTTKGGYAQPSIDVAANIAKHLQSVEDETGLPRWQSGTNGVWKDNTYVGEINVTTKYCPSVLLETAFFNNLDDLKIVTDEDKIDIIASAVAKSIVEDFHNGKFDNDQSGETKQNMVKHGTGVQDSDTVDDDKLNRPKGKETNKKSKIEDIKSRVNGDNTVTSGKEKINEIKNR